jgi:type I restriction enzyme S subunit
MSWEMVNINDICRPRQWKTLSMDKLENKGFPVYGANGIIGYYSEYTHKNPTIAITCRGATCGSVHITEPNSYINGNAMALDNVSNDFDIKFLYYYFQHRGFNDVISGSAQPQITGEGLSKVKIPLPPLATQKRIAEILDAADALRRKDQELLKKYDELAQAIFIDMFGDPVKNEKGWEKRLFKEFATFENGDRSSNYPTEKDFVKAGVPFYGTQNMSNGILNDINLRFITEEKFQTLSRGKLRQMDLVITLRGSIGNCVLFNSDKFLTGFINAQMMIIRVNNEIILADFLQFAFTMKSFQQSIKESIGGSAVPQITAAQVREFEIIIPPLEDQMHFVKIINSINQIESFHTEICSDNLFNSLIQKAFNGELV